MCRFSFAIFFIVLSVVNSEEYGWQRASINGIVSDVEGYIFPVQGYLTGQGNYAGTEQRTVPSIACYKHGAPEKQQLEQPVPSPNRRSSSSISERNFDFKSQPYLQLEINKLKKTDSAEPLPPQLINSEDILPETRVFLQETTPTPKDNLIDDIIIEPISETTTPAIEMQSNQAIVLSKQLELEEQKKYDYDIDPKAKQFISQSSVLDEPPNLNLRTECANKNEIDTTFKPPRRFLEKLTYDVPSQKNILEKNYHDLNENVDGSMNTKLPVLKPNIYKNQDSEKSLQQPNENMIDKASSRHYTYNNVFSKVKDPTKGKDITYINKNTRLNLMDIDRVCYACSTENNPTCWAPDRRTTVKYCRKSDNACVTKTFGSEGNFILIRDCAKTCNDDDIPGLTPKHKTCSVCYKDLCNSSHSINVYSSMIVLPTILSMTIIKSLLVYN